MPELPEVETFRRKIEKAVKNKTVKNLEVRPDKIIFAGKSTATVKKAFLGAKIKKCRRKGKYIWFEMSQRPWPVFHLGMTGHYLIQKEGPDMSQKSIKLVLEMNDGTFLIFKDPRRFGRIFVLHDPLQARPLMNLGPDVLDELPGHEKLYELLQRRKAPVKGVLLDQSVLSGIGNWMADEILFQSGLDPHRLGNTLTKSEVKKLRAKIKLVTDFAVKVGADNEKYPKGWLFHHRWGRKTLKNSRGDKIRHDVVAGRSTAWIPTRQK